MDYEITKITLLGYLVKIFVKQSVFITLGSNLISKASRIGIFYFCQ